MNRLAVILCVSLIGVAGCATSGGGPDRSPQVALPDRYANAPASAGRLREDLDWWNTFGDPTLSELVESALQSNRTLEAGLANVQAARAALKMANADLLPQASASLNSSADSESGFDTVSNSARLSASYELDLFGGGAAGRESARAGLESAEHAQRALALGIASDVATNYFNLQAARAQLDVARQNLEVAERIYEIVQVRYRAGAIPGFDVSSQEATLANARARIPDLEQQVASLEMALAVLVGVVPEDYSIQTVDLYDIRIPEPRAGLPSELLTRRPDLLQAEAELRAAEADIEAARAAFLPGIDLGAGLSSVLSGGIDPTTALSLAISQNVFSGGRLEGQLESVVARRNALIANYEQAILESLRDVEVALKSRSASAEIETELELALSASEKALEAAELRYRVGADDLTSLLNAQQSYYTASERALSGRLARLTAAVSMYAALGGGF